MLSEPPSQTDRHNGSYGRKKFAIMANVVKQKPLSADIATAAVLRDDPNGTLRNDPRCPQLDQIEFALTKPRRGHL